MGIPKKGSRLVAVDGKQYRFLVKEVNVPDHPDQKELSIVVQEDVERPGNVLRFRHDYGVPIILAEIPFYVRKGLKQGWDPAKRGAAFELNLSIE